ncbi:MAG: protein translocase subunit SecD [Clostridia bacterium]|nr:protein translocase subunit SecD [Clostridia bacterium]
MKTGKIAALVVIILVVAAMVTISVASIFPADSAISKYLPLVQKINLGLDLQGGVRVVLQGTDNSGEAVTASRMDDLKSAIERRVNSLGVSEPSIYVQGEDRLVIELAGVDDPEEAVNKIIQVAYLEFKDEEGNVWLTGDDLKDAQAVLTSTTSDVAEIQLRFSSEGAKKFADATEALLGKKLCIYLDGEQISDPTVQAVLSDGEAVITGRYTLEEANNLAINLRSGALPVQVQVIEKNTVGPTLGSDSLSKSEKAGVVGIIAVLIFMLIYYRIPGFIADIALIIYAFIVLLVYILIPVTLTLNGIAAFLLSLGIAADANIIIFERIKEELRVGKSINLSIHSGFKRGFTAVLDANLTTIIAAVVLYGLGTSSIKGFALTLIIGILASMFTAITMTRWMLNLFADSNITNNKKMFGA